MSKSTQEKNTKQLTPKVNKQKFDLAKNRIKEFTEKKAGKVSLSKVKEKGFLGIFDYKVTGDDLNSLTSQIQDSLVKLNNWNADFLNEFGEVYNALEALDKEYIASIITSIKSAEEASQQAKKASDQANRANEELHKVLHIQKESVQMLLNFKADLEKYKHLQRIDEVWEDVQKFEKMLEKNTKTFTHMYATFDKHKKYLKELYQTKEMIDSLEQLQLVDQTWSDVQELLEENQRVNSQLTEYDKKHNKHMQRLKKLEEFRQRLQGLEHLLNIDQIWEAQQLLIEDAKKAQVEIYQIFNQLKNHEKMHLKHTNEFKNLYKRTDRTENNVDHLFEQTESMQLKLSEHDQQHDKHIQWLEKLEAFQQKLLEVEHLLNVDQIWEAQQLLIEDAKKAQTEIQQIFNRLKRQDKDLAKLQAFQDEMKSLQHLSDIDHLWNDYQQTEKELHQLTTDVNNDRAAFTDFQNKVEEKHVSNDEQTVALKKKLKIAYIVSGGALSLSIIQLLFIVLGIL